MRVKQTGRSCTARRDDPCILLALFLLPAVGPGDVEELSRGAFQENAEVSLLFPLHFGVFINISKNRFIFLMSIFLKIRISIFMVSDC